MGDDTFDLLAPAVVLRVPLRSASGARMPMGGIRALAGFSPFDRRRGIYFAIFHGFACVSPNFDLVIGSGYGAACDDRAVLRGAFQNTFFDGEQEQLYFLELSEEGRRAVGPVPHSAISSRVIV